MSDYLNNLSPDSGEILPVMLKAWKKDEKEAIRNLTTNEVRYLVDVYYQRQHERIRAAGQIRSGTLFGIDDKVLIAPTDENNMYVEEEETGIVNGQAEPNAVLSLLFDQARNVEKRVASALDIYTEGLPFGRWLKSVYGIGPVIAAGLIAHVDWENSNTAGRIWKYAGIVPDLKWEKGQKRPWNARLKVLQWKAGCSFMKFSGRDECLYGKLYRLRKAFELELSESVIEVPTGTWTQARILRPALQVGSDGTLEIIRSTQTVQVQPVEIGGKFFLGGSSDDAEWWFTNKKFGKETQAYAAYAQGKLPASQIDARARRWAVKLFLSHAQEVAYYLHHNTLPPAPYVFTHLDHVDYLPPPNLHLVPGMKEALEARPVPKVRFKD